MRLFLSLVVAGIGAAPTSAAIAWSWSFQDERGTFLTDGVLVGGVAAPGVYTLTDFAVKASAVGATIGSLSGGDYSVGAFNTIFPYRMTWNGAKVTFWDHTGSNSFNWWLFEDLPGPGYFSFGWDTGNVNDPDRAAYVTVSITNPPAVGDVFVRPITAMVPEPTTWAMLVAGFGLLGSALRRKRAGVPAA